MTQFAASPAPQSTQRITTLTRRDIVAYICGEGGPWWGRLDEIDFLESLYDLDRLASTDPRFTTAREDIIQHRINNLDWPDHWVFEYPQFQLLDGPDEILLGFLTRFVHPEIQPDLDQSTRRVAELNRLLGPDGWTLRPFEFISGRPPHRPPVRWSHYHSMMTTPANSTSSSDRHTASLNATAKKSPATSCAQLY
jgi:hypothetical protein